MPSKKIFLEEAKPIGRNAAAPASKRSKSQFEAGRNKHQEEKNRLSDKTVKQKSEEVMRKAAEKRQREAEERQLRIAAMKAKTATAGKATIKVDLAASKAPLSKSSSKTTVDLGVSEKVTSLPESSKTKKASEKKAPIPRTCLLYTSPSPRD